jgi:hypothetical protein
MLGVATIEDNLVTSMSVLACVVYEHIPKCVRVRAYVRYTCTHSMLFLCVCVLHAYIVCIFMNILYVYILR